MTILSSKLQEIGFIKVQGQQVTPKQCINISQDSIYFSKNSMEVGLLIIIPGPSAHNTHLAFLDVIMGKSFTNNERIRDQELLLAVCHV